MQHPIFQGINASIQTEARRAKTPRFEVRDIAPQTVSEMWQAYSETGRIVVWSGGSESTIYKDPSINYLFRAWHDWTHIQTGADFTLQGETLNARAQARLVGTELAKIIMIETVGQAEHFFKTGQFPEDQVAFTIKAIK